MKFRGLLILILFSLLLNGAFAFHRVLIIGDSISFGYGVELDENYCALVTKALRIKHRDLRVTNLSKPGRTLSQTRKELTDISDSVAPPAICILEIGGNDYLGGVPIETAGKRMVDLFQRLKTRFPDALIIILGFGYSAENGDSPYRTAANKCGVMCLDHFEWQEKAMTEMRMADGVHPNKAGHQEIAEKILALLHEKNLD